MQAFMQDNRPEGTSQSHTTSKRRHYHRHRISAIQPLEGVWEPCHGNINQMNQYLNLVGDSCEGNLIM